MELNGLYAGGGDGLGVHIGIDVRFHNGHGEGSLQGPDGLHQGGGFAGAGGGHQVQQKDAPRLQFPPEGVCLAVVIREHALLDL